jgi:hypothetical protein
MTNDYENLIDETLIRKAGDKLTDARARLATATIDRRDASATHAVARIAADSAIAGNGDDAHKAVANLDTATKALDVTTLIFGAAALVVAKAEADVVTARGVAWEAVYTEGVRRRLAAAKMADQARAMLADAERNYADATKVLNAATSQGARHVVFSVSHSHFLTNHADEVKRWSQNYHNAWWPGLSAAGNVIEG